MIDGEKVIKGLECAIDPDHFGFKNCHDCFYRKDVDHLQYVCDGDRCISDALALLKAQEPQATTHEAEWHIFKGRRGATCSYCKYTFDDVYDPENYDYYCRHCGARMVRIRTVRWE